MNSKGKPKEDNIRGPWLLSEETLIKIDILMEKGFSEFNALIKKQNKEKSYLTNKKTLTIWFNNGTEEDFKSFKDAIVSDIYFDQKPVKFEYVLEVSSNRLNIILDSKYDVFGYYINCEDVNIRNNLCYDMQQIYFADKPNLFFSFASLFRGLSFLFYFLIFVLTIIIMTIPINSSLKNTKEKLHQILLKDDLQQEDYFEIIRYSTIINNKFYDLAIPNNNNQENLTKLFDKIIFNYLIIGFIICLIITATPRPSFAVGKGKKKVKFWKGYYIILLKYLPLWVLLPIILNLFSYLITKK
jgi:hypothetical protein